MEEKQANEFSSVQQMYEVARSMRRGFRYGQIASPIVHEEDQERMVQKMKNFKAAVIRGRAKDKFDPMTLKNQDGL